MTPRMFSTTALTVATLLAAAGGLTVTAPVYGGPAGAEEQPEFPPFEGVVKGLEKVVSTADGSKPLYTLYADKKNGRLLAELPANFESQMLMIVPTISGGDSQAGVMGATFYGKWRRVGKNLLFTQPNYTVRTDDAGAKDSVSHLYTDRVVVDMPILTMGAGGGPVIDLGAMMTQRYSEFFYTSPSPYGAHVPGLNARLASLTKAKAFPENVVAEIEAPNGSGRLTRLTYDIGLLEGTKGFKPREADNRVGYFYNWHQDFAEMKADNMTHRYISRWNMEKADPSLKMSPPKQPLVWYIEHTTPVKYRRYVRDGLLAWNEAFEAIGITGAVEVYQQDAGTGAHMDLDPEDARYNFFRWNTSEQGYAIGPSRTNPETGEILDADIVWHQGLTRAVWMMLGNFAEEVVAQTMSPETIAFFDEHPKWDPRVRFAEPEARSALLAKHAAGERLFAAPAPRGESDEFGPSNRMMHGCHMGSMISMNLGLAASAFDAGMLGAATDGELIDGLPEEFIGQMIRYIVAHEEGHTLGLQHNFSSSTIRTLEELNTPGYDGPVMSSVMEYAAPNINTDESLVQGKWMQEGVGPYDKWAIEFGYGDEKDREAVLAKATELDHRFGSQIATIGPDPRVITWVMGAEPLDFAKSRMELVKELRADLLEKLVNEGESWAKARTRYTQIAGAHVYGLVVAARYIGGSYINPFNKGDEGAPLPVEDVPADLQREALAFLIENGFDETVLGLTPEVLRHFGKEYWYDAPAAGTVLQDPSFATHDYVDGFQAFTLTMVLNPTTLRRVYDNEYRAGAEALTLAEVMGTMTDAVWDRGKGNANSFRRNLQREHVERLVDLMLIPDTYSPAVRAITTLASAELDRVERSLAGARGGDRYSEAHVADLKRRIERAREAAYIAQR